jgi:hypothetical protein
MPVPRRVRYGSAAMWRAAPKGCGWFPSRCTRRRSPRFGFWVICTATMHRTPPAWARCSEVAHPVLAAGNVAARIRGLGPGSPWSPIRPPGRAAADRIHEPEE